MKETEIHEPICVLPRGGVIARTSAGFIQVGATPETIKDTMLRESDVPQIYLLPERLFSFENGISVADFEFPIYYNFYLKNRKTFILGTEEDLKKVSTVIRESLYGPSRIHLEMDYIKKTRAFPRLKKEMMYFKFEPKLGRNVIMDDIVSFIPLNRGEFFNFNGLHIINLEKENFLVKDGDREIFLPKSFRFPTTKFSSALSSSCYSPPVFGITVIGSSHGFDPYEKTTGFIIWINRKGILVDPPVNTTRWLKENRINTKLICDLILTHCHGDHDAGTLQKILEERRLKLHTTRTIKDSFIKKYSMLTGIPPEFLEKMFDFKQVIIDKPHKILNSEFIFKYSFHSIPTIWFQNFFRDKSFVYSADMFNYPPAMEEIQKKKIMTKERAEEFLKFPWHHSLILHEAGIPPIHTPIKFLEELDNSIKERLYLIHISIKSVPEGKGLKLARSGIENTISCLVSDLTRNLLEEKMDIISNTEIFRNLEFEEVIPLIEKSWYEEFKSGELVVKCGEEGEKFYIIHSGEASIVMDGKEVNTYSTYDYFGETSIIFNIPRTATIYAKTYLKVLVINKIDFLYLMKHTGILYKAKNLSIIRALDSWELFSETFIFRCFSPTQKTELQAIMDYRIIKKNTPFIKKGEKAINAYLIKSGKVKITGQSFTCEAKRSDFIANISFLRRYPFYNFDALALDDVEVFTLNMKKFKPFLEKNPGIKVKLIKLNPLNNI
ncbi:MAG: Cyclic nucleotide-binding domain protein [bacterium ADurb.Bin363]|nr:MAG: Cyclic nucleotide-binding domain protein [bacterium ADurb.Bin363]